MNPKQNQTHDSPYIQKTRKRWLEANAKEDYYRHLADGLQMYLGLMETYGEDQGKLIHYLKENQQQESGLQEFTVTDICTKPGQEIAKELKMPVKRLERAFGQLYVKGILKTKWIKSRKIQRFWLDWNLISPYKI